MSVPQYRVAIVGFGCGGATAAILLARQGHEVHLYERAPANKPVGAGFLLQPSGMKVLQELGILDELLPQTAKIDKLYCRNSSGKKMLDMPYGELDEGLFGAGTHRGTFLTILEKHVISSGANIHWDTEITSFTNGDTVTVENKSNNISEKFDAIIIADGARSTLRKQLKIKQSDKKYPWGALWFIGKRTSSFDENTLWQAVQSTKLLAGFLPTGTDEDLISMFWSIRIDQIEQWRSRGINKWKSDVLKLVPHIEEYLEQIESPSQIQSAEYHDVVMKHWHDESAVIIGDAAHALSPQLGQGVNLAICDAAELALQISQYPIKEAFARYSAARKQQTRFYQFATRWTIPFFQSDYPALGALRNIAFPIANQIPLIKRQMVATMAGLKTGPVSSLPLEPYKNFKS